MRSLLTFIAIICILSCQKELGPLEVPEIEIPDYNHLPTLLHTTINGDSALVQLPYNYSEQKKYALLIAFGGGAHNGNLDSLGGVASKIRRGLTLDSNMVIICPQNDSGYFTAKQIDNFINTAISDYYIDTTRLYLTGFKVGGYDVLNYLSDNPEYAKRIASATPMTCLQPDENHIGHLNYAQQTKVILFCGLQDKLYDDNKMYAQKMNAEFVAFNEDKINYSKLYSPLTKWYNPNIYQRMMQYKKQ